MPVFLAQTKLSKGDLRLYLTNSDGYPQNAFDVRWTVYATDGTQISGKNLCAIKANTGEYYAPWQVINKSGNYYVKWQWHEESGDSISTISENFFVVNLSSYGSCGPITPDGVPEAGGFTYLQGTILGPGDLPLYIKNADGLSIDPFGVFWTVYNAIGAPVTSKTAASRAGVGEYYAYWDTSVGSGDYVITWEYMEQVDSPIEAQSMRFSVISPATPYAPLAPYNLTDCPCSGTQSYCESATILAPSVLTPCISPCPSTPSMCAPVPCTPNPIIIPPAPSPASQCCPYEIPRVVHLPVQTLPISGAWTNQAVYAIPERIRQMTFYVTYTRGAAGGYPHFKLLWGNGVEETQETMIDMNYEVLPTSTAVQNMYLQNLDGPIPNTDAPVNSILHVCVPGGATTVRLLAAEEGQPGAPGSAGITLTAAS